MTTSSSSAHQTHAKTATLKSALSVDMAVGRKKKNVSVRLANPKSSSNNDYTDLVHMDTLPSNNNQHQHQHQHQQPVDEEQNAMDRVGPGLWHMIHTAALECSPTNSRSKENFIRLMEMLIMRHSVYIIPNDPHLGRIPHDISSSKLLELKGQTLQVDRGPAQQVNMKLGKATHSYHDEYTQGLGCPSCKVSGGTNILGSDSDRWETQKHNIIVDACSKGDMDAVRCLFGFDYSPLMIALFNGHSDVA